MGEMEQLVVINVLPDTRGTAGPSALSLDPCLATRPGFMLEPSFVKLLGVLHEDL